jgi:hypothetical protein
MNKLESENAPVKAQNDLALAPAGEELPENKEGEKAGCQQRLVLPFAGVGGKVSTDFTKFEESLNASGARVCFF